MSAPRVLRWFAHTVEVLPGALGQLACSGLALLMVGGCVVIMVREDPVAGWVLGGIGAFLIVPAVLRWIADSIERRSAAPPVEASRAEVSRGPSLDDPSLDFGDPEEIEPMDFTEPERPPR